MDLKKIIKNSFKIFSLLAFSLTNSALYSVGLNFKEVNQRSFIRPHIFRSSKKFIFEEPGNFDLSQFEYILDFSTAKLEYKILEKELIDHSKTKYIDLSFPHSDPLYANRMLKYIDLLKSIKNSDTKVLIHCGAGADRVGVAATIALMYIQDMDLESAFDKSFSWKTWYPRNDHRFVTKVFRQYKPYSKTVSFEDWLMTYYRH
jgi:protein-tyrosine phosphatase